MKKVFLATFLLLATANLAFAGKLEREYKKGTLATAIKEAEANYKKSCGCSMKMTVDMNLEKSIDDMSKAKYLAESIRDGVADYCKDAEDKAALCKMATLKIRKGAASKCTIKGSAVTAETDGTVVPDFNVLTNTLDPS